MSIMMPSQNLESLNPTEDLFQGNSRAANKELKKLADWAQQNLNKSKKDRYKTERQWYLNLAFYFGQQNVQFRQATTSAGDNAYKLIVPPAPYYRARPVVNRIRPLIRTEMSKLTSNKPSASIVPASSEDKDIYAAQAGEQIWQSLYQYKKLHSILRRTVFWSSVTGNGFMKAYWDPNVVDPTGQPQQGINPETLMPEEQPVMGDIEYCSETPFHIFIPDLRSEDIEDQPYVIHAQMKNAEQLSQLYRRPITKETGYPQLIEDSFLSVLGINEHDKHRNVMVLEVWVKPRQLAILPEGGMFVVVNDKVVYGVPYYPYTYGKYPIAKMGHVPTGKFYCDSTIVDLIPLQREYNRVRGQIIEAKNRMAKPQLAAEQGSIDPTKVTSEPGQIIMYKPGYRAPVPIPLQEIPSYVLQEQDRIIADMDEISGQHEVSRGQTPTGVTAATAISYLQEQEETKLSATYDSLEEMMEKIACLTLNYIRDYWDVPRIIKTVGVDGSFDAMVFKGSDLANNTDIRIESGSALPVSKAAKQALIMDLMNAGFIDPNKGLEVMEIGGIQKIYEQVQQDVRQAQRENLKMAAVDEELMQQNYEEQAQKAMQTESVLQDPQGNYVTIGQDPETGQPQTVPFTPPLIVPVNSWDEHRVHIETHNKYRKSQAFDQLDDQKKELFEEHVNQHVQAIVTGAMAALPQEVLDQTNPAELQQAQTPQAFGEMETRDKQQGIDRSKEGVADYATGGQQ